MKSTENRSPKNNNKLWILFSSKCYYGASILIRYDILTTLTKWFKKLLTDCLDILYQDIHTLCKNVLHSITQSLLVLSDLIFRSTKTPPSELVPPQQTMDG